MNHLDTKLSFNSGGQPGDAMRQVQPCQEQPESPYNGPPEAYKKHIGYFWPLGCGSQDVTTVTLGQLPRLGYLTVSWSIQSGLEVFVYGSTIPIWRRGLPLGTGCGLASNDCKRNEKCCSTVRRRNHGWLVGNMRYSCGFRLFLDV